MSNHQYNPIKVVGTFVTPGPFGSIDILEGTVDGGEFAALARDNPTWTREHDRGGNSTRVRNNNTGARLTVTMSASSPTNDTLSRVHALDLASENQVGTLTLKDLNGTTRVIADGAFIAESPDPTFGSDRGSRAWVFELGQTRKFVGGHDPIGVPA